MKTFWIGMMAATLVLGTPIVAISYVLGKIGFSCLESTSDISFKTYLKVIALGFGPVSLCCFLSVIINL